MSAPDHAAGYEPHRPDLDAAFAAASLDYRRGYAAALARCEQLADAMRLMLSTGNGGYGMKGELSEYAREALAAYDSAKGAK